MLLGLHGQTDDGFLQKISKHLETHQLVKIMTTYDSLPKVCATLSQLGRDPYRHMQLVIDE